MTTWFRRNPVDDVDSSGGRKVVWFDEAGWKRVKRLYYGLTIGSESLEPSLVSNICTESLVGGFAVGALWQARPVFFDMKERFNEYQFKGENQYARRLVDSTIMAVSRHGLKMAIKCCILATSWALATATLTVYHNDIRISNFMLSSAVAGGALNVYRGPGRMLAGATIFSFIGGLPLGIICKTYIWMLGMDYPSYRKRHDDFCEEGWKKSAKKRLEWFQRMKSAFHDENTGPETRIIDHDVIIEDLARKGLKDEAFSQYTDPPQKKNIDKDKQV